MSHTPHLTLTRNNDFQSIASNINQIPFRFHANAQYFRLKNKGYDFEFGKPSPEEMEERTVYLFTETVEKPSKRYTYGNETVTVLKYMLKNSQGEVITRELTPYDLENKYESILKKSFAAKRDANQEIVSPEATALRRVLAERDPFPFDGRDTRFFYFDKTSNQRTELFLSVEQLAELDEKFFTKGKKETDLTDEALAEIESYTHQTHKKDVDNTQYCWVKLPYSAEHDPRALILGDITDCCQSIGAEADQCVKDALTLRNNGLYVLLRQKKPGSPDPFLADGNIDYERFEIVGESYVIKSSTGNLLLDSVEYLSSVPVSVIKETLTQFAEQVLAENPDIKRVVVGDISQEAIKGLFKKTHMLEVMEEGLNYGDAKEQSCIAERPYTHPTLIEVLKEDEEEGRKPCMESEMVCYLSRYVTDPNFFEHLQESLKTPPHPWAIQLLLSFNKHPSLDDLKPFYDWLEHDSDYGLDYAGWGLSHIDPIAYQSICRVPFESIALFQWNDILQYSTLNKIIDMVSLLGDFNVNRRNFPPIDLKLIQPEYLPKNYTQTQFFAVLVLLSKDSPDKAIDKTFAELIESTKAFIQEHDIYEPERISALLSNNALNCYLVRDPNNGNPVVSFRELVAIKGEPETYVAPVLSVQEVTRQRTVSIDSDDSDSSYKYRPDPAEKEKTNRALHATETSSALIKALTSEKALMCYQTVDKGKKPIITLKDLEPKGYLSSYTIEKNIEAITSHEVMQALKDGVLTGAHVIAYRDYYSDDYDYGQYFGKKANKPLLIKALRKGLFSVADIDEDFLKYADSEVFKALGEHLFTVADFKENIFSLKNSNIIQALREKLLSMADFKADPERFDNPAVIDDLRNKRLGVEGVISVKKTEPVVPTRSRASSISSDSLDASSAVERVSHSASGLFYHPDEQKHAEDLKHEKSSPSSVTVPTSPHNDF